MISKNKTFLKKIDLAKRGLRIVWQLLLVKITRKTRPVFMYLHLTNKCNLRCHYCYANVDGRFDNIKVIDLNTDKWIKLIDDSYNMGARYFHLYGGEPLIRRDIDQIIVHCLSKGLFVEIMTNGHFVAKKINILNKVQSVCISLDGDKKTNDHVRGDGNFDAVEKAIRICNDNCIPVRLHSTINLFNLSSPNYLPSLAQKWKTSVSYSVAHVHDYEAQEIVKIPDTRIREFLSSLIQLKKKGFPIDNTYESLEYTIKWPFAISRLFRTEDDYRTALGNNTHELTKCVFGKCAVIVDSEGYVIKCINLSMNEGLKFQHIGFAKAYYHGLNQHECFACPYPQFVETSNAVHLNLKSILKGLRYHF